MLRFCMDMNFWGHYSAQNTWLLLISLYHFFNQEGNSKHGEEISQGRTVTWVCINAQPVFTPV